MYRLIRPLLFRLDPERAHQLTLSLLRAVGNNTLLRRSLNALYAIHDTRLEIEAFGLRFKNPVGLAAGYDKNGAAVRGLSTLGFGHVEVGTVTLLPQVGNPKPRVHRIPTARGAINSMGFPNDGVDALLKQCNEWYGTGDRGQGTGDKGYASRGTGDKRQQIIDERQATSDKRRATRIGINIGKGKDTPLERAAADYCELLKRVYRYADYITVNVSSPNTLNLRQLQAREAMESLLKAVTRVRDNEAVSPRVPVLVKIAPDLNEAELDDALAAIALSGIDGIIATNTTTSRAGIPAKHAELKGGLSGEPLRQRATRIIRYVAQHTAGQLPIIGVGGIMSADDAFEKIRAGAWLVQVYTGMVYAGPGLAWQINRGLLRACKQASVQSVRELVGVAWRS
jgi:dihydroorotate dehydrogenase